jgi:acetylornithine deacetylase
LQSRAPHPIHGTASLHTSLISGGRELSTYPDQCVLQIERRTIQGEPEQSALAEVEAILHELRNEDPDFKATARSLFSRPPYVAPFSTDNEVAKMISAAVARKGIRPVMGGMSFWTDAAILGQSGVPSIVFGPGGAGLHSVSEYVLADDVLTCRDSFIELAREFCSL